MNRPLPLISFISKSLWTCFLNEWASVLQHAHNPSKSGFWHARRVCFIEEKKKNNNNRNCSEVRKPACSYACNREKIARQAAVLRAHTNITSRQGQQWGSKREKERETRKPHRNYTFFDLMASALLEREDDDLKRMWKGDEKLSHVVKPEFIKSRSDKTDEKTTNENDAHFSLFPRSHIHSKRAPRVTEQQGAREGKKMLWNVSGWLTLPGACLFHSHEHCTGMRFEFPHRSSQFRELEFNVLIS